LRLHVIQGLNRETWVRPAYFNIARRAIENIVGNELAMQLRVNLSIQLPNDDSSLLPVHSDVWSGDSPYEIVLWVPYVNCYKTKSMYMLPSEKDRVFQSKMQDFKDKTAEDVFKGIEKDVDWFDVPYGHVAIFTQNQMHGNRVNIEHESRWSSNCRFKSVFAPYSDKKLGEFFEPIIIRPATTLGGHYNIPSIFGK